MQRSLWLDRILRQWMAGRAPKQAEYQQLAVEVLADQGRSLAFGITATTVEQVIQNRFHLLKLVYPACRLCHPVDPLLPLWETWLPLAQQIASDRQSQNQPLIQGILGLQGTGKTALARLLKLILERLGYPTLCLSLDDLYKTYAERQELQSRDPRLIWRGPPGTHDITLGLRTLEQLRSQKTKPIPIPRFDKAAWGGAGDRTSPEWVQNSEIILFEGWFVGLRPIDPRLFASAPPPIFTPADQSFAQDSNGRLRDYLPLWELLDRLLVLRPVDYRLSYQWRRQAEHQLITSRKSGMTDPEIDQFVGYFWQALHPELFLPNLLNHSSWVDLVIDIQADHNPGNLARPGKK